MGDVHFAWETFTSHGKRSLRMENVYSAWDPFTSHGERLLRMGNETCLALDCLRSTIVIVMSPLVREGSYFTKVALFRAPHTGRYCGRAFPRKICTSARSTVILSVGRQRNQDFRTTNRCNILTRVPDRHRHLRTRKLVSRTRHFGIQQVKSSQNLSWCHDEKRPIRIWFFTQRIRCYGNRHEDQCHGGSHSLR